MHKPTTVDEDICAGMILLKQELPPGAVALPVAQTLDSVLTSLLLEKTYPLSEDGNIAIYEREDMDGVLSCACPGQYTPDTQRVDAMLKPIGLEPRLKKQLMKTLRVYFSVVNG